MKSTAHIGLILLCCILPEYSRGQFNLLSIDGVVRSQKDESKLPAVRIQVIQNGKEYQRSITKENGRFEYKLPLEATYEVVFSKNGYVSKKIAIDARHIPEEDAAFGFEFGGWNVKLFREVEGLDVSLFDQPVARIVYDTIAHMFTYDKDYIKLVEKEMERLEKEYKRKLKEEALARKAEAKRKEAEKLAAVRAEEKRQAALLAQKKKEERAREAASKALLQQKEKEAKQARLSAARKAADEQKKKKLAAEKIKGQQGKIPDDFTMPKALDKQSEEFKQALAKKYPKGMTEEKFKEGNISYIRRIIVEGNKGTEYIKAMHPWGGKFYFKNGVSITERAWIQDTEKAFQNKTDK